MGCGFWINAGLTIANQWQTDFYSIESQNQNLFKYFEDKLLGQVSILMKTALRCLHL